MRFYLSSLDLQKGIVRSVIAVAVGLFFCFFPGLTLDLLVQIFGGIVLFVGVVSFLALLADRNAALSPLNYFNLALCLLAGLFLVFRPGIFSTLFTILLGVVLGLGGLGQLLSLLGARKWGVKPSFVEYLLALILFGFGLTLCFLPRESNEILMILFGSGCLFYGITNLVELLILRRKIKKNGKRFDGDSVIEDVDYEIVEEKKE